LDRCQTNRRDCDFDRQRRQIRLLAFEKDEKWKVSDFADVSFLLGGGSVPMIK